MPDDGRARYRDAAEVVGAGLTPTWAGTDGSLPGVTIDHVLADRRIGITDYRVVTVRGTDHRAVYTALLLDGCAWSSDSAVAD